MAVPSKKIAVEKADEDGIGEVSDYDDVVDFVICKKYTIGVFRTLSNIYDGILCKNNKQLKDVNYFGKKPYLDRYLAES